ncbi:helix-turn-helix transcriptional regulator [Gracilimonas mengyeensis]|uniref:Helix-turn-helix n=1 Tax=Gracilimonas mengyeensis TaxID=1302730 RepID=A0A521ACD9_9BACT|nr:helix-turn-helix transcriptional regulator [Gracilimonas mengyeensis]SMO32497.1 Helix-turn-helix [Gracilimonas mengyeensis]
MTDIRKKIEEIAIDDTSGWKEDAKYRRANRKWLRKSQDIALRILDVLEEKGMQQKDLAEALDVSPQQISKIVKGKQNLTLETISKLEQVLGVELVGVPKYQTKMDVDKKEVKTSFGKQKRQRVAVQVDFGDVFKQPSDSDYNYRNAA